MCNSSKSKPYVKVKKWQLHKCQSCGFVQVINKPTEQELKEIYSNSYFSTNKYEDIQTLHKEYRYRLKLMKKYSAPGGVVLDYGCAKADFISFAKNEYLFYGMDYSTDAIEIAKEKHPDLSKKLFYADQLDAIKENTIDAVVLWDVIEHIWDPVECLNQLYKKVKIGGHIILSTPKVDTFFPAITRKYWPFMTPPEHLSFFSNKAFEELGRKTGLHIVESRAKGKWVNAGFMLYKIKRIVPYLVSGRVIRFFQGKRTSKLSLYAPTGDIQYVVLKKSYLNPEGVE